MMNNIKKNIRKICFGLGVMLILSLYLALALRSFTSGAGLTFNPVILLRNISRIGFPLKETPVIFLLLIGSVGFMVWRSNAEDYTEDERHFRYSKSGVYGTASLLQETDLEGYARVNLPKSAQGTILGQLDNTGSKLINTDMESRMNKHVAVFGASGSGKSRCYARPFIIQSVKRRESVIVTDPKGELYESTAQYLKDNGYIVKIFDLVHPEKSDGWDCLKELRGDEIRAQIFANVIIQNTGSGKGDIWDTSAMALLKALLLRVERGKDFKANNKQSIGEAYQLIQNPQGEKYLDSMFNATKLSREEQLCIGPYMTFKQGSDNMRGNIITGLATRLQVFQNEVIRLITAADDIDLTLPATKPCAYFCIMSDQHTTLNFLSTLFFSFLFIDLVEYADMNGSRCPVPVNFLLDEFPNIGSIPDFEKKIATVRSRAINISIIFQGITQLQERYPLGKWQGILGNCDTHLFLGCNDSDTAEFISDRAGQTTVKVKTEQHEKVESLFNVGRKHSTGDGKRAIFTVDEIMRFPLDKELIIFRGKNAMMAQKYDFSLHPEANKFHTILIQERPSIYDGAGRSEYQRLDEEFMAAYLKRVAEKTAVNDREDTNNNSRPRLKEKLLKHWEKQTEGKKPGIMCIKEGSDIEIGVDDCVELTGDIMDEDDIEITVDDSLTDGINKDNAKENTECIQEFENAAPETSRDTDIPDLDEILRNTTSIPNRHNAKNRKIT